MLSRLACFSIPEGEFARWRLRLAGDLDRFAAKHLDYVVAVLRQAADDDAVFPLRLAAGSVVVELASTRATRDRLWNLYQSGDLERLLGQPVAEMVRLPGLADADELALTADHPLAHLGQRFEHLRLRGVSHSATNKPFDFEFLFDITDRYDSRQESLTAIDYFFEVLSVPANDLWVNLGPAEMEQVMPPSLRELEIGRVLLESDLVLKKLTAALLHPDSPSGRRYWATLQSQLRLRDGVTPAGFEPSFRLWMRPDRFGTETNGANLLVKEARLAIQGEEAHEQAPSPGGADGRAQSPDDKLAWEVFQDLVLPVLQREIDEGRLFARLRQLCFSFALADAFRAHLAGEGHQQDYFEARHIAPDITLKLGDQSANYRMDHWRRPGDPADKPLSMAVAEANQRTQAEYRRLFDQGVFYVVRREPMLGTRQMAVRSYLSGAADLRLFR